MVMVGEPHAYRVRVGDCRIGELLNR